MDPSVPLLATHLPGLPAPRVGKVREGFDLGDALLLVATDRVSAYDVVLPNGIPGKGRVLTQLSAFWFDLLGQAHHVLTTDDQAILARLGFAPDGPEAAQLAGRTTLARKADPLPVECVARGYLAGSLAREYRSGVNPYGIVLPEGLRLGDALPEPIFTPATKANEGHDENISFARMVDLVGHDLAHWLRDTTLDLYGQAHAHAARAGLILADTKFEFGLSEDGPIWIDEALTPDSSRYWDAALYAPGHELPGFDKQFVRDWLETQPWDKRPPGPTLPADVVEGTRRRYEEALQRLTHVAPL